MFFQLKSSHVQHTDLPTINICHWIFLFCVENAPFVKISTKASPALVYLLCQIKFDGPLKVQEVNL